MKRSKMKRLLYTSIILMFSGLQTLAQNAGAKVEMADQFRADGKIYIVVIVILVVVAGLSIFAFRLDRKLSRLERRLGEKND